ncbi:glyoxalase, partial [Vibrio cholerae O1 biovar El Tor]|nr:glyoxalase [Vibrio cholerae O1 biovar El Tor]
MSLSTLQAELASAKTEYEAKELEIRNLFSEKNTQERRLQTLVAQVAAKRKELSNALSQSSAETLTSELQSLESQYQACQTLINNISNYLTVKAGLDKKNASELVERAQKNLLNFIYNSIKSELKVLTDEQVELMKDFVVIEKLIRSELSD